MNNFEDGAKIEGSAEKILTGEEVMEQIKKRFDKAEFVRELKDENGLYLLEAQERGETSGEFTLYVYQRKGNFGKYSSIATTLEKVYFENDGPIGGDLIAEYDISTGEWIDK